MKRVIALLLTIALLMGVCPVHIFASEDEFVGISIVLNGIEKQCRVIESGAELLFSGEDLAEFGGYTYRVDGENAYFTRGQKTVRVNVARNILIPFDGTDYSKSNKNITLNTSVREKDGVYYFPGTQLLPWLSVNCFAENGKLCIITDEISVWDLIAEFNPEDFAFDFAECCEDLGKSSKWVKAGAAFQGFGLETIFGWLPTFGNDSNEEHDYYDIFEEMLQEQICSQTSVDEMMEDVDKINEWMDWAEAMKVKDELPDDWKAIGMVSDFIGSAPMGLSEELGLYLSSLYLTTIERDHQEKLNAIKYIVLSGGNFPDEMRAAAETIYLEYTDYVLGILGKGIDVLYEALKDLTFDLSYDAIEKVAGEYFKKVSGEFVADVYEIVLAVLDFPGMVEYDCAEGIRRVDCYSAIAAESRREYRENKDIISDIGIQNTRSTAYLYLYAVEKNWRTMSDYALESGFLEYAAEYRAHADAAQEMASKFLQSAFSQVNDSPEYVAGEPRRKQGYTDKLKSMFADVEKHPDLVINDSASGNNSRGLIEYIGRDISDVVNDLGNTYIDEYWDGGHCYTYDDLGAMFFFDDVSRPSATEVYLVVAYRDRDYGYGLSAEMTYPEIVSVASPFVSDVIPEPEGYYPYETFEDDDGYEYITSFMLDGLKYIYYWTEDPETHDSYMMDVWLPYVEDENQKDEEGVLQSETSTVNALLSGLQFYAAYTETSVEDWTDESVMNAIYGKLVYQYHDEESDPFLNKAGCKYQEQENDVYLYYDLEKIQKITMDAFGQTYPTDYSARHCYVSEDKLVISPATGESTQFVTQHVYQSGDTIIAVGGVFEYGLSCEFAGYFKALLKEKPSSLYGYTLISLQRIDGNQSFDGLIAKASSELEDSRSRYGAGNVIDGHLDTAWAEGVQGKGIGEWISIEKSDSAAMEIIGIEISAGYQKNQQTLDNNGWPYNLLIECDDGYTQTVMLFDVSDTIVFNRPVTANKIKITILEASAGQQYEDTCISEIRIIGLNP